MKLEAKKRLLSFSDSEITQAIQKVCAFLQPMLPECTKPVDTDRGERNPSRHQSYTMTFIMAELLDSKDKDYYYPNSQNFKSMMQDYEALLGKVNVKIASRGFKKLTGMRSQASKTCEWRKRYKDGDIIVTVKPGSRYPFDGKFIARVTWLDNGVSE